MSPCERSRLHSRGWFELITGLISLAAIVMTILLSQTVVQAQARNTGDWTYSLQEDPITAVTTDFFQLRGTWVGPQPSFPYEDAIPLLTIGCTDRTIRYSGISIGALVKARTESIDFRLDDVPGSFSLRFPTKAGDKLVILREGDFAKVLASKVAVLRVVGASDPYLTMHFEIPTDNSKLLSKCNIVQRQEETPQMRQRRELLGGYELSEIEVHGFKVPIPNGSTYKITGSNPAIVKVDPGKGLTEDMYRFMLTALPEFKWAPVGSTITSRCWAQAGEGTSVEQLCFDVDRFPVVTSIYLTTKARD